MRAIAAAVTRAALAAATVALPAAGCRATAPAAYAPGLGEIMTFNQMRHIKLWFAGTSGNWRLARYEIDELEEGFADAQRFHPTHPGASRPLTELIPEFTAAPLHGLRAAVADRDSAAFAKAYDSLTAGCNGCHQAAGFAFNVVRRPEANPFSDQDLRPPP